jgi:hypothetical protein
MNITNELVSLIYAAIMSLFQLIERSQLTGYMLRMCNLNSVAKLCMAWPHQLWLKEFYDRMFAARLDLFERFFTKPSSVGAALHQLPFWMTQHTYDFEIRRQIPSIMAEKAAWTYIHVLQRTTKNTQKGENHEIRFLSFLIRHFPASFHEYVERHCLQLYACKHFILRALRFRMTNVGNNYRCFDCMCREEQLVEINHNIKISEEKLRAIQEELSRLYRTLALVGQE